MAYSIIETASIKFQNRVNLNNSSPLCLFHVKWNHFHVSVNILNMGSNKKQLHLLYTIKYFLTIFFQIFHFHSYHKRKFRLDITQTKRSKYQNAKWRLIKTNFDQINAKTHEEFFFWSVAIWCWIILRTDLVSNWTLDGPWRK